MRKLKYLCLFAGLLLLASSCTRYRKTMNGTPVNVQMNLNMADVDYVGEVTGTATQSYVLGIPYGGRRYYSARLYNSPSLPINIPFLGGDRGVNNAMYDAMQQRPDADFLIPFNVDVKTQQEFLGSKKTYSVRAKAFKIKTK